jgi:hypothetical protein
LLLLEVAVVAVMMAAAAVLAVLERLLVLRLPLGLQLQ